MANIQYIGARYVPIIYTNPDDGSADWKAGVEYEPLTIVTYNDDSYTSKKAVPDNIGDPENNPTYWVKTGNFNASLLALSNRVVELSDKINTRGVSYEDFGAKMDGVTDDSAAVILAHAFAKANHVPIVQHGGTLKANFQIDDIDYDMNLDFTLVIDDSTPKPVYKAEHDGGLNTPSFTGTFTHAANTYASAALKGKFFLLRSGGDPSALIGDNVTTGTDYYHEQPMMIDKNGRLITSNYFLDSLSDAFTLVGYSDISEKAVTFKNLHVKNNSTLQGLPLVFQIYRNNVTVKNITIDTPVSTAATAHESLINIGFCCNVGLYNIFGYANSNNTIPSYIADAYGCANVTMRDCMLVNGWHTFASSVVDGLTIDNCDGMSFDNHWGLFGRVEISNCKINDSVGFINLGYGDASVLISHVVENSDSSRIVILRRDLPIGFSGNLTIESCDGEHAIGVGAGTYSGSTTILNSNIPTQKGTIRISNCKLRQPFSLKADLFGMLFVITVDNCIFVSAAVPKIGMIGDMGAVKYVIINNCYYDGYDINGGRCKFSDNVLKNCSVRYFIEQCTIDITNELPSTGFFKDCYFLSKPTRNATSDVLHLINCWSNNSIAFEAGTNVRVHDCWNITSA